jgi:tetratricopeptide (TPR) repeat protein
VTVWRRSWELDPTGPTSNANYGLALILEGRTEEAIHLLERTLELAPDFPFALRNLAMIHHRRGDSRQAAELYDRAGEPALAACALAQSGAELEARVRLEELEHTASSRYVSPYHLATIHACLGEADTAFALLEQAYRERIWELTRLNIDWCLLPIRGDARFNDLARRVGLPSTGG